MINIKYKKSKYIFFLSKDEGKKQAYR